MTRVVTGWYQGALRPGASSPGSPSCAYIQDDMLSQNYLRLRPKEMRSLMAMGLRSPNLHREIIRRYYAFMKMPRYAGSCKSPKELES